jgi:hypothetical protein
VITWRVPVVVFAVAALLGTIGFVSFPRKALPTMGGLVEVPNKRPANDASGPAGWVWPAGVPGWRPGEKISGDYEISGVQPIEMQPAQLAAARAGLDPDAVRVVQSMRPDTHGALAIVATQSRFERPASTCLAAVLQGDAPVNWLCPTPRELGSSHVLVAAARMKSDGMLYVIGVARGDVDRVMLTGIDPGSSVLYQRSRTWGQFGLGAQVADAASLRVYGHGKLLETVPIRLRPGRQGVFR